MHTNCNTKDVSQVCEVKYLQSHTVQETISPKESRMSRSSIELRPKSQKKKRWMYIAKYNTVSTKEHLYELEEELCDIKGDLRKTVTV